MSLFEIGLERHRFPKGFNRRWRFALSFAGKSQVVPRFGILAVGFHRRLKFRERAFFVAAAAQSDAEPLVRFRKRGAQPDGRSKLRGRGVEVTSLAEREPETEMRLG